MKTTIYLSTKHVIQAIQLTGAVLLVYLLSYLLANAVASTLMGPGSADRIPAVSVTNVAADPEAAGHPVQTAATENLKRMAADNAARVLKDTRRQVWDELHRNVQDPLPSLVVSTGPEREPGPPFDPSIEYLQLVADANGTASLYTMRELVYEELKTNTGDLLDLDVYGTDQGDSQATALTRLVMEDPLVTAGRNAAQALLLTRGDVIRELDQNLRRMILTSRPETAVERIAWEMASERPPAHTSN